MFREATAADLDGVWAIYDAILTGEETGRTHVGWVRGIYPTPDLFRASLDEGVLFVCELDGMIAAAARINQVQAEEYSRAPWTILASPERVMVLHTMAVHPTMQGRGIATGFVRFYEQYAARCGCTCLRLDTNFTNTPGRALYPKLGYHEVGVVPCTFNGIEGVDLLCYEKSI